MLDYNMCRNTNFQLDLYHNHFSYWSSTHSQSHTIEYWTRFQKYYVEQAGGEHLIVMCEEHIVNYGCAIFVICQELPHTSGVLHRLIKKKWCGTIS